MELLSHASEYIPRHLSRERSYELSKRYLGSNIALATILVVIIFIISQAWSDVYVKTIRAIFGREPSLVEETIITVTITVTFILVIRYIFRVTLIAFA